MTAILREEPEALASLRADVPPLLEQIVHHGLEKKPEDRFQSMRDVAFNLKTISATSRIGVVPALAWLAFALLTPPAELPRFKKLTFESGAISTARFAPDGQTVLHGAWWRGEPIQMYSMRLDASGSRPMGIAGDILAISPNGEMAH